MHAVESLATHILSRLLFEFKRSSNADLATSLQVALDDVVPDGIDVVLTRGGKHIELELIDTATGRRVGWLERVAQASGLIHHKGFWIDPGMRGTGLGRLITDTSMQVYRRSGIRGIVTVATSRPGKRGSDGLNGAYTWARSGFDWFSAAERKRVADEFMSMLKDHMAKQADVRKGTRAYTRWLMQNERELKRIVDEATTSPKTLSEFVTSDGVPLGKMYLTGGVQWKGIKWL